MTATATTSTAPSPTQVDELAKEYRALEDKFLKATLAMQEAMKPLAEKKKELIALVRESGTAHREKSWLLHGIGFEIMGTFSQRVSLDGVAVDKFREAAKAELTKKQFFQIFEMVITYRPLATAAEFVRTSKLSRKLKALHDACQVIKDNSPTLVVREKSA